MKNVKGDKPSWFHRARIPAWLLIAAAICALLSPLKVPTTLRSQEFGKLNLMFVMDFSGSMEASDWPEDKPLPETVTADILPPSRIAVAKEKLRWLLTNHHGNSHIGLVAFARRPYLVCPLMNGTAILEERMEQITTDDLEDGTAIGDAINLAVRSLKTADGPKAVILLSDGVDHSQDDKAPLIAAEAAAKADIVIHTVGIGGKHAYHPVNTDGGMEWRPVGEELNEPQLTEIARLTNGHYFKAGDANALSKAIESLAAQVIAQPQPTTRRVAVPLTPLLLVAALLAVASLLSRLLLHAYF
ncbi:MAG: VWA domain-containing protein [Victivallales bacterium]|nr:VWA domain-containing protein [Victivallales bacterium]